MSQRPTAFAFFVAAVLAACVTPGLAAANDTAAKQAPAKQSAGKQAAAKQLPEPTLNTNFFKIPAFVKFENAGLTDSETGPVGR